MKELRQDNLRPHQKKTRLLIIEDAHDCSFSDLLKPVCPFTHSFTQHMLSTSWAIDFIQTSASLCHQIPSF